MSIPSHTPYWGLYEHLPHSYTPKNMKKWKVQSERVFKCDHLDQSATVTFILLPLLEGTVHVTNLQAKTEFQHCSTALLNPRPVYSCGWRCSKLYQLQSYITTIPYCPWHLGYGKGLLDNQIGTQVLATKREVSQHALKGLSFSFFEEDQGECSIFRIFVVLNVFPSSSHWFPACSPSSQCVPQYDHITDAHHKRKKKTQLGRSSQQINMSHYKVP